jgi:uncharacterized protein involved in type VI secretion and phage assembly
MGRLQVSVPALLGDIQTGWALPCVPFAGDGVGFFMLPPAGSNVWVEFEQGDLDHPIWSGCLWGAGQAPAWPAGEAMKVLKTDEVTIIINDLPGAGGVTIELSSGLKLAITSTGVEITSEEERRGRTRN